VDAILLLRRTGWTVARISVALGVGYDVVRAVVAVTGTARGVVRSMPAYCDLAERGRAEGWQVMALDLPIDPTTPQGELVYGVLVLSAQFERRLLAQRVKEAMASR